MAKSIEIIIKETSEELKKLKKTLPLHKQIRVQMLLLYKSGKTVTKELIEALGVNKTLYLDGSLSILVAAWNYY